VQPSPILALACYSPPTIANGLPPHRVGRPTVTTDYMSLFGGAAETQPADSLANRWTAFQPGFDAT
jgi:hypothetical protein